MDFSLLDYDCIGFDLDNTLCEYNIGNLVRMEYSILTEFLTRKGYPCEAFKDNLDETDIDFLQRGLILDFPTGNIIKISKDFTIFKAFHGTKEMTQNEISNMYENFQIDFIDVNDLTKSWEKKNQSRYRILLDYFDMPASLAFANCVDYLGSSGETTYIKCGHDVLEGLRYMFARESFSTNMSKFFKMIKSDPKQYIKQCSNQVLDWLRYLKTKKTLFLITGSNVDYANFTASNCLSPDWHKFFNIVICYAKKPSFFTSNNDFLSTDDFQETQNSVQITTDGIYSQGNWNELYKLFQKITNNINPKCIYFGDNLVEDVYTPFKYNCCDTIAITEELDDDLHQYKDILASKTWGSFCNFDSLWPNVMRECSKLYLPSVRTLVIAMEDEIDEIVEY